MSHKFKSLVGGVAAAGLIIAGTVAANAADSETIVKVGYFEVQGEINNVAPTAWFSEKDDDIAGITIGEDSVTFAASAKSVGLNKIVTIPFGADAGLEIDASGTARYSIVVQSDAVDYLRLTASAAEVDADTEWYGTGFFKDGVRTPSSAQTLQMTLADWADADSDLWGTTGILEDATITQIGARHFSGEGEGAVKSISANGTKYVFGTIADLEADLAAANAEIGTLTDDLAAALAEIADLKAAADADASEIADLKAAAEASATEVAGLKVELAAAVKAGAQASNQVLKARAQLPYSISGKTKVGQTLRAKGKKFKGIDVSYQWRVGKKNAGKKATLKLKKRDAGKVVRLTVTKSYKNAAGKTVTVKSTVRAQSNDRVSR